MDDCCLELGTHKIIAALIARRLGIDEELARLEKDWKRAPEGRPRICRKKLRGEIWKIGVNQLRLKQRPF